MRGMHHLTDQEKSAVESFKQSLVKEFGTEVIRVRLFGSRARGEGNEDSDLDILVLLKKESRSAKDRIFEISSDILLEYEIDISPLVMSEEHFESMKKRERRLPKDIEKEGVDL